MISNFRTWAFQPITECCTQLGDLEPRALIGSKVLAVAQPDTDSK